jgi:uncharacterized protein with ParB-like and HNH nuclease domain
MSNIESEDFSPTFVSIGEILSRHQFRVPKYQRSFAWPVDAVEELFSDIKTAIEYNKQSYFIGSIVVTKKEKNIVNLVDGQQRLATISILIAAMRDYFIDINDAKRSLKLANYLYEESFISDKKIYHMTMNYEDNDFFINNIILPPDERAPKNSKRKLSISNLLLYNAYEIATKHVKELITKPDPIRVLGTWEEFINYKLKVIFVKVADEANAFMIFETLNDRGLDLAISDLLKNYLLSQAGDRIDEMLSVWQKMYTTIESIEKKSLIVTFIRHYWSAKHGITREKDLYRRIRNAIVGEQQAFNLANELEQKSYTYQALFNSDHGKWNEFGPDTDKYIQELIEIGVEQNRPLLIAIFACFDNEMANKALRLIIAAAVRTKVSRMLGSSLLEKGYSETARKIFDGEITSISGLISYMNTFVPNDENFRNNFVTFKVSKHSSARYYLSSLEQQLRDNETRSHDKTTKVNLEHILPKNPMADWGKFTNDDRRDYLNRLGNMTLIAAESNSQLGDKPFSEKKKIYKISQLKITKALSDYDDWTPESINKRQTKLADLAVQVWRFKE